MTATRRSKQRERILEYLESTTSHPTAQNIYEALLPEFNSLSPGTVYRNLGILEEKGLVRKIQYGSTFDRYDAVTETHYHFICRLCGRVYDVPVGVAKELEKRAASSTEHKIENHRVDFFGVCKECLAKNKEGEEVEKPDTGR
ncbi:MAG: transcriptional repressor [Spirochaetaceae bacterium]